MSLEPFFNRLRSDLEGAKRDRLYKNELILRSPQQSQVSVGDGDKSTLINMCSNNYLGLANSPELVAAARHSLLTDGFGMASVRFICGSHAIHKELEERISQFLGTEDTILFSSCFDANAGVFEALLGEDDIIISDALNHASIIDGIRLCKARRLRYLNNDIEDLERALKETSGARTILIATDGVFSMDGIVADLEKICRLAERHNALVLVDDSHAVGFIGPSGRGTPALFGVQDKVQIVTGTLGKALGGASGGYVSGRREIVEWLRQRARPYLFSNALMPAICAAALAAIDLAEGGDQLRESLARQTARLRSGLSRLGVKLGGNAHPIVPVLCGEAHLATELAGHFRENQILAVPFSFPVVPKGQARVRMQVCASHSEAEIDQVLTAVECFPSLEALKEVA
ncbi:MAG: glycine C-acetyltransferase [Mesorhizobium sp.]|uniref:glycine C-acetyltransferase n=1 Tax=Mesorhizobium sp. TaxID=1871066 RepID=UPI0012151AEC|nr:glycine C-acetyltransferase [Mesorhizobium sp.]TIR52790.1 MAG: glycine C-acetyltransferase [Mesorhizobium sp.]